MKLNNFSQHLENKTVSLKAAMRRMRSIWLKGEVSRFDAKLARILTCSVEEASEIRENWVSLGFLCYDRKGLLTWRNMRGF